MKHDRKQRRTTLGKHKKHEKQQKQKEETNGKKHNET